VFSSKERTLTRPSIFFFCFLGWPDGMGVLYKGRAESTSVLIRSTGTLVSVNFWEQGYGVIFLYFPYIGSLPLTVW
jgi:hypothetical protein